MNLSTIPHSVELQAPELDLYPASPWTPQSAYPHKMTKSLDDIYLSVKERSQSLLIVLKRVCRLFI